MYLDDALRFCNRATPRERRIKIKTMDAQMNENLVTVGNELDRLKEIMTKTMEATAERDRKYKEDPEKFLVDCFKKAGVQDGLAADFVKQMAHPEKWQALQATADSCPEIVPETIEKVKALPERKDVAMLIIHEPKPKEKHLAETYRVFAVDTKRLEHCITNKKKKYSAFTQISVLSINSDDTMNKSEHDRILGVFVKACFQPYLALVDADAKDSPYRPGKVILEDKQKANQPRIQSTLEKLGCPLVEIMSSDFAKMFEDNKNKIMSGCYDTIFGDDPVFGKETCPTSHALNEGYVCMNCGKADMNIMQCQCKKVFFCSEECNAAMWPKHKFEHKRTMKKLAKKEGKKAKRK